MDTDHYELDGLRTRVAELEQLVQQLGQQLDSLSEHLEWRFQRHYERIEATDDDARRRDRDLENEIDRVRSDAEAWARDASAGRGW
jgi:predicted  nucleic acid-binding Zn-ribbon protein